jgi:hypothetical protein
MVTKPNIPSEPLSTKPSEKKWGLAFKWLLMAAAYAFLAYKLITFNQYSDLISAWQKMPATHFGWLLAVFALLPLNWLLEALKWKMLTASIQRINLKSATKAVLAGIYTGFFTPNRVGEFVGRLMFLNAGNRKAGVTLSAINSLTQNMIMALCGIPACVLFFGHTGETKQPDVVWFIIWAIVCLVVLGLIYLALPAISKRIATGKYAAKVLPFTACLTEFKPFDLLKIMLISLFRYLVFSVQFGFMLYFFGIDLTLAEALIAIPTTYLFVTFTPAFAFSEAAIRSSYAVLVIGAFSGQIVGIALAGLCIWLVNFVIPMLVGSVVMMRSKY